MPANTMVPIVDPNRGFRMWYIDEIFNGEIVYDDKDRYVPNKDDLVVSYSDGFLRVVEVDYTTGLSILEPHDFLPQTGVISEENKLLGAGPGKVSESYRVYLDTSVIPHVLAFDARLKVYGTTVKYTKVIQGTVLETGETISRQYDNQGELISENIPLELVLTDEGDNVAIKTPKVGYCSKSLPDGETVTAVFYDDLGSVVSTAILLVKNTQFIRNLNESVKYITGIELESPFLSEADDRVLECPINIPVDAITRRGIVHYSDGTKNILPIDGTKFNLFGLQRFTSTVLGQRQPVSLIYYLSPDEVAEGSIPGDTMHIHEQYLATSIKVDGAYSVKLFTYPVWIDTINGYRLEHFLYNLDRDEVFNVTSLVELGVNSRAFNPLEYGVSQDITFTVDLSKVSDQFKNYRHIQTTRLVLLRPGMDRGTNWTVSYDNSKDPYGEGLSADVEFVNSNLWNVDISNGFGSQEEWLREIYEPTLPLFDETTESEPPTPNFFKLIAGSVEMEYPISMWDHKFVINNLLSEGDNIYIQFFRRGGTTDLQLSIAALIMHRELD